MGEQVTFLQLRLLSDTELGCILQAFSKVLLLLSPHTHALKEGLRRQHRPREASDPTARCGLVALTLPFIQGCGQAPWKQGCKQISVSHRESLDMELLGDSAGSRAPHGGSSGQQPQPWRRLYLPSSESQAMKPGLRQDILS